MGQTVVHTTVHLAPCSTPRAASTNDDYAAHTLIIILEKLINSGNAEQHKTRSHQLSGAYAVLYVRT